jgi:hypothetical protein
MKGKASSTKLLDKKNLETPSVSAGSFPFFLGHRREMLAPHPDPT